MTRQPVLAARSVTGISQLGAWHCMLEQDASTLRDLTELLGFEHWAGIPV